MSCLPIDQASWDLQANTALLNELLPQAHQGLRDRLCLRLNNSAWDLCTIPDAAFRDGKRAVPMASLASEHCSADERIGYLDTLAAAYAETGQWDEAERTIRRAIQGNKDQSIRLFLEKTLKQIQNRQAIRE